jgi:hypothetical protein
MKHSTRLTRAIVCREVVCTKISPFSSIESPKVSSIYVMATSHMPVTASVIRVRVHCQLSVVSVSCQVLEYTVTCDRYCYRLLIFTLMQMQSFKSLRYIQTWRRQHRIAKIKCVFVVGQPNKIAQPRTSGQAIR